jgi:hypothetical protein
MSDIWTFVGGGVFVGVVTILYQEFVFIRERKRRNGELAERSGLAALLVRDEIYANLQTLRIIKDSQEPPGPLVSGTYQDLQVDLARGLPPAARDAVRHAYVFARASRVLEFKHIATDQVLKPSPFIDEAIKACEAALELLKPNVPEGAAEI